MDELILARAVHVLAVVHWIGGVTMVTLVLLPAIQRHGPAADRLRQFEAIESRFATQARVSTLIAGASGFYLLDRLPGWDHVLDPAFWWLHAMIMVWAIFTFVLFVAEPLFLHRWFRQRAMRDPDGTLELVRRLHLVLLTLSLLIIGAGVIGAHGGW